MATDFIPIPDWFSWENQGAGSAVADLNGDGRPELIVFQIDSPAGQNQGCYRVGWNLNEAGNVTAGWSPWIAVSDWFPWENQGSDITVADLDGNGRLFIIPPPCSCPTERSSRRDPTRHAATKSCDSSVSIRGICSGELGR
jgi:hypothetical protein